MYVYYSSVIVLTVVAYAYVASGREAAAPTVADVFQALLGGESAPGRSVGCPSPLRRETLGGPDAGNRFCLGVGAFPLLNQFGTEHENNVEKYLTMSGIGYNTKRPGLLG